MFLSLFLSNQFFKKQLSQITRLNLIISFSIPLKERHEAVVRRTMERSQKPKQKHNRWSWGGPLQASPRIHSTGKQAAAASTDPFLFSLNSKSAVASFS